jgi:hypothetical protein
MTGNRPAFAARRPFAATLLAMLVLFLAAWNGLRLAGAIASWRILAEYGARPPYLAASGGFWLLAGLSLAWGLWRGKAWARGAALLTTALYTAWYWFDRLAFQPVPHANWPFALTVNFFILFFVAINAYPRSSRDHFTKP